MFAKIAKIRPIAEYHLLFSHIFTKIKKLCQSNCRHSRKTRQENVPLLSRHTLLLYVSVNGGSAGILQIR